MKIEKALGLYLDLKTIQNYPGFVKFQYCISKNIKRLQTDFDIVKEKEDAIQELIKPFAEARNELQMKYAKRDEHGRPVIIEGKQLSIDPEKTTELDEKIEVLKEKHKEILDKQKEMDANVSKFIKEVDSDYKPFELKFDDLPVVILNDKNEVVRAGISQEDLNKVIFLMDPLEDEKK